MLYFVFALFAFICVVCALYGINALNRTVVLIYCDSGSSLSFLFRRSVFCYKRIFTTPPMRCGLKTQDMPLSQRHFHLYVVLIRFPVTARTPQGRTLCLFPHRGTLPESCYTPESRICRKRLSGNLKELLYVCLLSLR